MGEFINEVMEKGKFVYQYAYLDPEVQKLRENS